MERTIEKRLVKGVEKLGGYCLKWSGANGVPDRIVLMPGRVWFVELKQEGGKLSAWQKKRHREFAALGHDVVVLWSNDDVDAFCASIGEID